MESHEEHLQNLRQRSAAAAMKAIDYLDGDIRPYLEAMLGTDGVGIRNWEERGVIPIWTNLVARIIGKSALTYQAEPTREITTTGEDGAAVVDELATEAYRDILKVGRFHTTSADADQITRLLRTALYLIQFIPGEAEGEQGRYTFDVLSQHNSDAIYDKTTGKISSLLYASGSMGDSGGQIYYHWTDEKIVEYELIGESLQTDNAFGEPNTYGFIPVAKFFDTRPPRSGLWAKPAFEQLLALNDAMSLFNTEVKFSSRFGTIGTPVTNMSVPDDTVINVDAILELITEDPDVTPFFEYRIPPANIEEFKSWLKDLVEETGMDWGVNVKVAGEGAADSGFKLIVEELPTLVLWKKRQPMAADAEDEVYDVIRRIDKTLGDDVLPDQGALSVEFAEPELPVNKKEEWEISQGEMALGVLTKKDYLAKKFPSWSPARIDEYLADIDVEKTGGVDLGFEEEGA